MKKEDQAQVDVLREEVSALKAQGPGIKMENVERIREVVNEAKKIHKSLEALRRFLSSESDLRLCYKAEHNHHRDYDEIEGWGDSMDSFKDLVLELVISKRIEALAAHELKLAYLGVCKEDIHKITKEAPSG